METKRYLLMFAVIFLIAFVAGCEVEQQDTEENFSEEEIDAQDNVVLDEEVYEEEFAETIVFQDENGTTTINRDFDSMTASVKMDMFYDSKFFDMSMTEFTLDLTCGILALAFFDEEGLEEFNAQIEEWNSQDFTVKEDVSEEAKEDIEDNPLEGFEVSEFILNIYDKELDELKASCSVTGADEEDIEKTIY